MNKLIVISLLGLSLTGCGVFDAPVFHEDKELRQELFFKCMKSLPAGPAETKYNDWDEVVAECGSQAYYLARKCVKNCE